ncbi:MAG: Gldg family protein [Proteobacteria bacterium]|nr:Gldg family protein [Pseudomonadota bacterium]
MNRYFSIVVLVAGFLAFTLVNNMMLGSFRLDLTENGLYSVSDGTREIIDDLEEPINLYFFFSEKASEDLTALRAYSRRVREMLEEYQLFAGSNIKLHIVDPAPFSEQEDQAAEFGLQSVPVNQSGDALYFGLAGTNALDGQEVLPFFQPDREAFLEYELTKLIYNLSMTEKPRVALYSELEVEEGVDPRSFQPTPGWIFMDQLKELFQIDKIDELSPGSIGSAALLLIVHPGELEEDALYAVDQHVMSGGKLIVFVDPLAEMVMPGAPGMSAPSSSSSELNRLTATWGVTLREGEVLGDSEVALMVGGANGTPVRHFGILGFTNQYFSGDDIATADLESINFSTAGILDVDEVDGIDAKSLITSSSSAGSIDVVQFQFLNNPAELQQGFQPTGDNYSVAVRLSGRSLSSFPEKSGEATHIAETDDLNVVIVADTDVLADRLWVQVQNFFGQQIANAFADNGSFVTNLVENLSGSSALIEVRSRGQFSRPFVVVEELRRLAEAKYLENAEDLQLRLAETERQLSELESARVDDGLLTLSPEQEAALVSFQDEKLRIRKDLRDVRHRLDQDIDQLGGKLKFINILLMPLLLTLALLGIRMLGLMSRGHKA